MAKGPTGKIGNRKTRYSKRGNTSWERAYARGVITQEGRQTTQQERKEHEERVQKFLSKIKEMTNDRLSDTETNQ